MRKLFFQMMVSLDGYFEPPDKAFDWHVIDEDFNQYSAEMLGSIDAILLGRVLYQGFAAYWPTSTDPEAERMNALEKVVFSKTLDKVEWNHARLVKGDAVKEIERMKAQPGKDLWIGGSNLAASLAPHRLIDEYRILVAPIVLGGGTPLLQGIPGRLKLELVKSTTFRSGVVCLYYRPA